MTGDPKCKVRVSVTNSIQLTAKFAMSITDFFKDDGVTKFIDRMCALLKITDKSRVKIVGVFEGSVEVVAQILPPPVSILGSAEVDAAVQAQQIAQLNAQVQTLISSGSFEQAMS